MSTTTNFVRDNGWLLLFRRVLGGGLRRWRDSFIARKLGSRGFRCGRTPRLFGLVHMRIGNDFAAGDNLWIEAVTSYAGEGFTPAIIIGNRVSVSDSVHIACTNAVSIGAGTLIGSRVLISDHGHGAYRGPCQSSPDTLPAHRPLFSTGPVSVGSNVWIGDGVAVLAGADIGDGAIIGANSVVTGSIPAATIALGSPARPVRRWSAERQQWLALDDAARFDRPRNTARPQL